MAMTRTTLGAACGSDDLKLRVASSTGATVGCIVQIGDEFCVCTNVDTATTISVRSRGSQGSRAKAHTILAPVIFGLGTDFPDVPSGRVAPDPGGGFDIREAAVDGDADAGAGTGGKNYTRNTEVQIVKATAYAVTLTAPSQAQEGVQVRYVAGTAGAHALTFTPGLYGNTTSSDVATSGGIGSSITLRANNGAWGVSALGGFTVA